jgi:uncharacterized cupin superfamily protein
MSPRIITEFKKEIIKLGAETNPPHAHQHEEEHETVLASVAMH